MDNEYFRFPPPIVKGEQFFAFVNIVKSVTFYNGSQYFMYITRLLAHEIVSTNNSYF